MRTTVDIPDSLAKAVRERLARQGRTLRDLVVEGLRLALAKPEVAFRLKPAAFTGTPGFAPGVGPDSAIADLREDPSERGPAQP